MLRKTRNPSLILLNILPNGNSLLNNLTFDLGSTNSSKKNVWWIFAAFELKRFIAAWFTVGVVLTCIFWLMIGCVDTSHLARCSAEGLLDTLSSKMFSEAIELIDVYRPKFLLFVRRRCC